MGSAMAPGLFGERHGGLRRLAGGARWARRHRRFGKGVGDHATASGSRDRGQLACWPCPSAISTATVHRDRVRG